MSQPQTDTEPVVNDPLRDDLPWSCLAIDQAFIDQIKAMRAERKRVDLHSLEKFEREQGGITRIDVWARPGDEPPLLRMFYADWVVNHTDPVIARRARNGWTVENVRFFLEAAGWLIRENPKGFRAWRYAIRPVRSRHAADNYKDHLRKRAQAGDEQLNRSLPYLDLLFDL